MRRRLMTSIALSMIVGAGAALAQEPVQPPTPQDDRPLSRHDDDRGPGFGWIGLLGLAGLLGLKRSHADEPVPARAPVR